MMQSHKDSGFLKERGGIFNIHKPSGLTSFEVVRTIRKLLGEKKVGHCGTLDPMACGVLVVLYGSATALSEKLVAAEKLYRAKLKMGIRTDTGDITGKIIERLPVPRLNEEEIKQVFKKFCGSIQQQTPLYSAVKREGKKLYEYARKGIPVVAPKRFVEIYSLELLSLEPALADEVSHQQRQLGVMSNGLWVKGQRCTTHDSQLTTLFKGVGGGLEFRVCCSKGTYIRSLAEDLGKELGTCATLSELTRERSGSFAIEESIPWEQLLSMNRSALLARATAIP